MVLPNTRIKALFFDFMGTCLDWHSGIVDVMPHSIETELRSQLALEWRQRFFDANEELLATNGGLEDIDITHRRTLESLLEVHHQYKYLFDDKLLARCVAQWHSMPAWSDVLPALQRLKEDGVELFVLANGTTRLQLDLCNSSGLCFDMLFSSELLGLYKPAPGIYQKALELTKLRPEETAMVAAHAYDLRGAKEVGMKTIYVKRWTDDVGEDMSTVRKEVDCFLEDMSRLPEALGAMV